MKVHPSDIQQLFASHRAAFASAVRVAPLDGGREIGLRSLQVNAIMGVMGHWLPGSTGYETVKEATRTIVHDGDPNQCIQLTNWLDDNTSTQQDAEAKVAEAMFAQFGHSTEQAQFLMHELLLLRIRTVLSAAQLAGDESLSGELQQMLDEAVETLLTETLDDGEASVELLPGLLAIDREAFGQPGTHLQTYIEVLQPRASAVLCCYEAIAPVVAAMETNALWETLQGIAPSAKSDPNDVVRGAATLCVTVMTNEIMNREELPRRQQRQRLREAAKRCAITMGLSEISIDWGQVIADMAGCRAQAIPPAR